MQIHCPKLSVIRCLLCADYLLVVAVAVVLSSANVVSLL